MTNEMPRKKKQISNAPYIGGSPGLMNQPTKNPPPPPMMASTSTTIPTGTPIEAPISAIPIAPMTQPRKEPPTTPTTEPIIRQAQDGSGVMKCTIRAAKKNRQMVGDLSTSPGESSSLITSP